MDLRGRARGERAAARALGGGAAERVELVRDAAQVRVDRGRVVAAARRREVLALDLVAFHSRPRIRHSRPRQRTLPGSTSRTIACATKCVRPRSRSTVEASSIRASTGAAPARRGT